MKLTSNYMDRRFVCYLHFLGLDNIQLGIHLNWKLPNVEIHLPFCFIRVGYMAVYYGEVPYRSLGRKYPSGGRY